MRRSIQKQVHHEVEIAKQNQVIQIGDGAEHLQFVIEIGCININKNQVELKLHDHLPFGS